MQRSLTIMATKPLAKTFGCISKNSVVPAAFLENFAENIVFFFYTTISKALFKQFYDGIVTEKRIISSFLRQ